MSLPLTRRLALTALALALAPSLYAQDGSDAFKLKLAYTGEAAVSLDGGKEQGSAYAGQLMCGTDVDLQRLSKTQAPPMRCRIWARRWRASRSSARVAESNARRLNVFIRTAGGAEKVPGGMRKPRGDDCV